MFLRVKTHLGKPLMPFWELRLPITETDIRTHYTTPLLILNQLRPLDLQILHIWWTLTLTAFLYPALRARE